MTQDTDIVSPRTAELCEELRDYLNRRFRIAVQIRKVGAGRGYRLYQIRKSGNRHLADVRFVKKLPATRRIAHVLVILKCFPKFKKNAVKPCF